MLRALAGRIVREEGFALNRRKSRVARRGSRQRVTGVTVNDTLGLSRKERRRLRALIPAGHGVGAAYQTLLPSPTRSAVSPPPCAGSST